jgi:hypothetical protein
MSKLLKDVFHILFFKIVYYSALALILCHFEMAEFDRLYPVKDNFLRNVNVNLSENSQFQETVVVRSF